MIKHLFKLVWNKKGSNALLIVEIFVSFLVLFSVTTLFISNYRHYAQPLGYEYENVWVIDFSKQDMSDSLFQEVMHRVKAHMRTYPEVLHSSLSSFNTPFSMGTMNQQVWHEDKMVLGNVLYTDEDYAQVLGIELSEGRWYQRSDLAAAKPGVVLNRVAKEALFGDDPALGKIIQKKYQVVGIIDHYKGKGDFQPPQPFVFFAQTPGNYPLGNLLIKVRPGTGADFEARLFKDLSAMLKEIPLELSYLSDQRRIVLGLTRTPMLIGGVVCAFLLFNVGLGLFGVLWHSIRKRREEIGLRRALGASRMGLSWQFLGEAVLVAALGVAVGLFFALQLPLLQMFDLEWNLFLSSASAALLVIFGLTALCAYYPSRQAANIEPAEALREE
jgi:putative ABC transport system permease protein